MTNEENPVEIPGFDAFQSQVKCLKAQADAKEKDLEKKKNEKYWSDLDAITKQVYRETLTASDFIVWLKWKLSYLRWALTIPGFKHPAWIRYSCLDDVWAVRRAERKAAK